MHLQFDGQKYWVESDETVLDCLIRHGIHIPNSCRSGICQTCMLRATAGQPSQDSQKGLRPSRIEQNYFLSCSCLPEQDMEIVLPDTESLSIATTLSSIEYLNTNTLRLRLALPEDYSYHAGQYLRLFHPSGESRNYSIASQPDQDEFLELHVRILPGGLISDWLVETLQVGDKIAIGEAIGDCYYIDDNPKQSLLLIGTGTGLAPLYGVLRDAIEKQHLGDIHLYHGSSLSEGLYLKETLHNLTHHADHSYNPCASDTQGQQGIRQGRCNVLALEDHPILSGWRVFICGNPAMVKATQRAVFLAGASMSDILVDSFLTTRPTTT
ncbi:MAG: 2Fe-2S iron-sulfur cluster-binding protein [Thiohalomonadales bacterium]